MHKTVIKPIPLCFQSVLVMYTLETSSIANLFLRKNKEKGKNSSKGKRIQM